MLRAAGSRVQPNGQISALLSPRTPGGPHIAANMVALPELVGKPPFRLSPTSELLHGPARDIAVWTHGGSLNSGYVGANVQPRRPDLDRLTFASSLLELMQ